MRTTLRPDLPDGTYVANYKVVSADGHPISGAIKFGVGNGQLGDISALGANADPPTERLGTFARWLTYTAALLAAGLAFFLVFVHDGGADRRPHGQGRAGRRPSSARSASLLTIVVQAVARHRRGPRRDRARSTCSGACSARGSGWSDRGPARRTGPLPRRGHAADPRRWRRRLAFYGGLAVTTSFVLLGSRHRGRPNRWLAIGADVVHVALAAAWFGGLVGLTMTLRARTRAARAAGLPEPTLLGAAARRTAPHVAVGGGPRPRRPAPPRPAPAPNPVPSPPRSPSSAASRRWPRSR